MKLFRKVDYHLFRAHQADHQSVRSQLTMCIRQLLKTKQNETKVDHVDFVFRKNEYFVILFLAENQSELMKNVVFVLSGFQNPLRTELRTKAAKMGATYNDDWDKTCTHLMSVSFD